MSNLLILLPLMIGSACAQPSIARSPVSPPHVHPAVVKPGAVVELRVEPVDEPFDDASRLEEARFEGPNGIKLHVTWHTMTGTTHVAEQLVIATPRGALRFAAPEDEEGGETIPLMERAFAVGSNRWVVLGWSSYGEGMQTEHAWLIDDGAGGPRVVDTIAWTTDRSHAGVAIDASAGVRIGIPIPDHTPGHADDETDLHNEGDWLLEHGKKTFALAKVKKLPATEIHVMALRDFYTPPFQDSPSKRRWAGRFVWFAADKRFALQR